MSLLLVLNSQGPAHPGEAFEARLPTTLTVEASSAGVVEVKAGDTWPPLRMLAADVDGPLPLGNASSLVARFRNNERSFQGAVEVLDPDEDDGFNARYVWADGDTIAGRYLLELVITWVAGRVETVPSRGGAVLRVNPNLS